MPSKGVFAISTEYRAGVLAAFGATAPEIEELLAYNKNIFVHDPGRQPVNLPLPDEPFVDAWEGYVAAAVTQGAYEVLQQRLIQFKFPVREGISRSDSYQAATLRLGSAQDLPAATGLILAQPDSLELALHQTPAGRIPILQTGHRADFVTLVQALTARNEPVPVPQSMGASMVTGYNNWDRIFAYKQQWATVNPGNCSAERWQQEFRRLIPHPELYRDRFIIVSDGPYSAVPARDLGLTEPAWRHASLVIRREHECVHYFTLRLFSAMRNNVLDELIADYMGIVAAAGHYKADWFLRFVGLESFPICRESGRLQNYRGNPPLSAGAFRILQALVKCAAENLEKFDCEYAANICRQAGRTVMLVALTRLTLEELASRDAGFFLQQALAG